MMELGISIFLVAVAVFTILAMVLQSVFQRRLERHGFQDSVQRMQRILAAVEELPHLKGKKLATKRREIAKDLLRDNKFVHYLVANCYFHEPKDSELRKRALALRIELVQLNW